MTNQMDDMKVLQSLGTELDPPAGGVPRQVRRQVLAGIDRRRRPIRLPATRALHSPSWRPAIAAGLVTAVAIGLWAAPIGDRADRAPSNQAPSTAGTGSTFVQPVNAAAVLHNASVAAQSGSNQVPRPNQFIFSESLESGDIGHPQRRQVWSTVDGKHEGLLRTRPSSGAGSWEDTVISPGMAWYISDLPTDADAMVSYLEKLAGEKVGQKPTSGASRDAKIWKNAEGLISDRYMPAESKSALFAALATLPGAKVEEGVTDAAGRHGIAVGLDEPLASQFVFDAKTYQFLAVRHLEPGMVVAETVYLQLSIVDTAGQLP